MKEKIVNGMQIFSRAIIIPVLFLPIVGIIIALSSILINPIIVGHGSLLINIGNYIAGGLWPIMNNLSILFCVGIAMGIAKDRKAEAALLSVMAYLIFLGANNEWLKLMGKLVKTNPVSGLYGTGQTVILGFQVVDMGVFLGIILGILVAVIHNKFSNKEFPGAFAFYGNTKLVLLVLVPVLLVLSIVLSYVWPLVAMAISSLTGFINAAGYVGVFLYGFLNRVLIPTGLHHLIWVPFEYSNIGGILKIAGKTYYGAYNIFLAQLSDPSIKVFDPSAKYLQFGMVKMFGLVGVALAFYKTAKPEKKATLKSILLPAVATSVLVGITEPLEFTFLFVSLPLWLVYSAFDGVFQTIVVALGVRTYSAGGLIDFLTYNLPAGISRTRWPITIGVGLVELVSFFFLFSFLIKKFKLKTPGREDNEVKLHTKKDYKEKVSNSNQKKVSVAKSNSSALASVIVDALGGKTNIETVDNCFSRLRVKIKEVDVVDEAALKSTGALGVIKNGNNIQVIYGPKVNGVRNAVDKYLEV